MATLKLDVKMAWWFRLALNLYLFTCWLVLARPDPGALNRLVERAFRWRLAGRGKWRKSGQWLR